MGDALDPAPVPMMRVPRVGRAGLRRLKGLWHRWEQQPGQDRGPGLEPAFRAIQAYVARHFERFDRAPCVLGRCNVCGQYSAFFCPNTALYRESLVCAECRVTSRYRSIARGVLRALRQLRGVEAASLAEVGRWPRDRWPAGPALAVYDTQPAFYGAPCSYPIPDLLARCPWIAYSGHHDRSVRPIVITCSVDRDRSSERSDDTRLSLVYVLLASC